MAQLLKDWMWNHIQSTGNSYLCEADVLRKFSKGVIAQAIKAKELVYEEDAWGKYYSLPQVARLERAIATKLVEHVHVPNKLDDLTKEEVWQMLDNFEEESEKTMGFHCTLDIEQRNAVLMAVNAHMGIITGGPGTGKTTVLNAVLYVERNRKGGRSQKLLFAAPTGKAARRMTEALKKPASTIQRLMKANAINDRPITLYGDILVIDEISMLDTVTTYLMLKALSPNLRVLLLGDVQQLPSVGYGSVLRDLIDSCVVPYTMLEKTFRQKAGSGLADNIQLVKMGNSKLVEADDFKVIKNFSDTDIVNALVEQTISARKKWGADNVILLTPYKRKGITCANRMNEILQKKLNPSKIEIRCNITDIDDDGNEYSYECCFKKGDPVIQLKNRFDCPIANGDVGKITKIFVDDSLLVDFGHYLKIYRKHELNELNLCYAMSVHKSQGSEYACVVTCALEEHKGLLNRNMVYTDITRAKKECIIFCKEDVLSKAFKIEAAYERITRLCEAIQYAEKKYKALELARKIMQQSAF